MKKFAFVLALSAIFTGAALAEQPVVMYDGPGGGNYDYDRAQLWIDPPDPLGNIGSSEYIADIQLDSEIANDFILEQDATVALWRWWGGFWNGYVEHTMDYFILRIYDDAGCVPGNMLAELQVDIADVDYAVFEAEPTFVYEYCYPVDFTANLYWFGVVGAHVFPPQFGRLAASGVQACESVFKSAYFAYPDWVPASSVFGEQFDASQEMLDECDEPVATEESSWGAIKSLYR